MSVLSIHKKWNPDSIHVPSCGGATCFPFEWLGGGLGPPRHQKMGSEKIDFSENVFFERLRFSTTTFCLTVYWYNSLPGPRMPPHNFSYISLSIYLSLSISTYIYIYIYINIHKNFVEEEERERFREKETCTDAGSVNILRRNSQLFIKWYIFLLTRFHLFFWGTFFYKCCWTWR